MYYGYILMYYAQKMGNDGVTVAKWNLAFELLAMIYSEFTMSYSTLEASLIKQTTLIMK